MILKLKLVNTIFRTHIFLSLAAVLLTVSAQIQLGLKPQWQPYLFLSFAATLFEYNRHRIVIFFASEKTLNSGNHKLILKNQKIYFWVVLLLGTCCAAAALSTKTEILVAFGLFGIFTFSYSGISFGKKPFTFKLREIPYLKIFLISFVWSAFTIVLPVVEVGREIFDTPVILLFTERFFFIFAIAIQFDIRDMQADRRAGLKTIPLLLSRKKAIILSYLTLFTSLFVSVLHYQIQNEKFILWALCISVISTFLFLKLQFFRYRCRYYYQILDVAILLQGLLVLGFYLMNGN